MGIVKEFKTFVSRGNVIDLAVGMIMGSAFTTIVSSLVNGVVMPFIGYLISGINFSDMKIVLSAAEGDKPEAAIAYGAFIQQVVVFLCTAFVVFMIIKLINKFRAKQDTTPAAPAEDVVLLKEIRDLLAERHAK